jgi:hypothetical protein
MTKKIFALSVSLLFVVCAFAQDNGSSKFTNSWYEVTVFKAGEVVFNRAYLQIDGFESVQSQANREDQLFLSCNGASPKEIKSIERTNGVSVATNRNAEALKVAIEVMFVEKQNIERKIDPCREIRPNEQVKIVRNFSFPLQSSQSTSQFKFGIDSQYSALVKVSK